MLYRCLIWVALSFWILPGNTGEAQVGEPLRLQSRSASASQPTSDDTPVAEPQAEQVTIQALIVELRGDIPRALKEAGLDELGRAKRSNRGNTGREPRDYPDTRWLRRWHQSLGGHAQLEVLTCPKLTTNLGQSLMVEIETAPGTSYTYFVQTGERTFALKEVVIDAALGCRIDLKVQAVPGELDQIEISPLRISTTTLDRREPIAGVALDVGKPIVSTRSLETSLILLDGGEPGSILLPGPPGRQAILFLSARRVKPLPAAGGDRVFSNPAEGERALSDDEPR